MGSSPTCPAIFGFEYMKNINSHFVTRGLTKPWEINKQRDLAYYDFTTNKISTHSSKSLFAERGLFNGEEEQMLNKKIETPLINLRNKLKKNKNHSLNQKEWEALAIYFQSQASRYMVKDDGKEDQFNFLKEHVLQNDSFIKGYTSTAYQYCKFFHFVQEEDRYFFPELGFIIIPILVNIPNNHPERNWAEVHCKSIIGIPFSPRWMFVIFPKPAVDFLHKHNQLMKELVVYFGVGCGGNLNRVLIPPDLYKNCSDENELKQLICNYREQANKKFSDYGNFMRLAGLSVNSTHTEFS